MDRAPLLNNSEVASPVDGSVSYNAIEGKASFKEVGIRDANTQEPWLVYMLTFMACIGGFLFGYDTGVVSGAMIFVRAQFQLSSVWHELIVSVTIGAAAVFALVGGVSSEKLGRKRTIIGASVLFMLGAVMLGGANSKEMLLAGRFVVGAGVGLASVTVPVYIAEATPASSRGRLVTTYNLAVTFGQFSASFIDGVFSSDAVNGWRFMMGLAALPALIQFVGFFFMPESPRWLVAQERHEAARAVLGRLIPGDQLEAELEAIQFNVLDQQKERSKHGSGFIFVHMLSDPRVRKALVLGCGLQLFQQLCGINTVMYYSASIIQMSGVADDEMAVWLAALVALVNFVFTFVGIALVDRIGRRPLTLASLTGVLASLIFLAIGFMLAAHYSPPVTVHEALAANDSVCSQYQFCDPCVTAGQCGFCFNPNGGAEAQNGSCLPLNPLDVHTSSVGRCSEHTDGLTIIHGYCPTAYGFMAVLGLGLYLAFFAPGMGPMPWTINSEIYPLWARSAGSAAATSVNWMANLVISMTFLTLTETVTKAGAFWIYSCLSLIGLVFLNNMLPETKGKALEDIQVLFENPWCSEGPCATCRRSDIEFEELDGH